MKVKDGDWRCLFGCGKKAYSSKCNLIRHYIDNHTPEACLSMGLRLDRTANNQATADWKDRYNNRLAQY